MNLCFLSHPEEWADIHVFFPQEKGGFLFIESKKIIRAPRNRYVTEGFVKV